MAPAPNFRKRPFRLLLLACPLLAFILATACEKDDICVDGDTPLLVITLYRSDDPATPKNATTLRVVGLGNGTPVNTFADRSSRDSIGIPLRADTNRAGFVFIYSSKDNDQGADTGNRDTLYFDYTVSENFVSRACGFVPNYENLAFELQQDTNNWIDSVAVIQPDIRNNTSAHVSIFH